MRVSIEDHHTWHGFKILATTLRARLQFNLEAHGPMHSYSSIEILGVFILDGEIRYGKGDSFLRRDSLAN